MLTRRCFTNACAAAPLFSVLPEAVEANQPKRLKFVLRLGLIWSRGRQLRDGTWSLAVGLYDCRRRAGGELLFRHFHASEHFISLLQHHEISVRRSSVQPILLAASAVLHHGPVGFDLLLERLTPVNEQRKLYVDPNPTAWGEFTMPMPVERHFHVEVQ